MSGKNGGMVDDGAMLWMVDDIHGNELGTERKNIQFCIDGHIRIQNLECGME